MAQTPKLLAQARNNDTTNDTLYTVPASTTTQLTSLRACNTTATAATVRIFVYASGGSASEATAIVYGFTIPANDYHEFIEKPIIIEAAGVVAVQNGTANAITFTASGLNLT